MSRIEITRADYVRLCGHIPDAISIGEYEVNELRDQVEMEYVFIDEAMDYESGHLRRLQRAFWEEHLGIPSLPNEDEQLPELERLLTL